MKTTQIIIAMLLLNITPNIFSSESFDQLPQNFKNTDSMKIAKSLKKFEKALEKLNRTCEFFLEIKNNPEYVFYFSKKELIYVEIVSQIVVPKEKNLSPEMLEAI